ncbi:hypothetical protein ACHMWU_17490 [Aeromicrobium sp. UC242_57]
MIEVSAAGSVFGLEIVSATSAVPPGWSAVVGVPGLSTSPRLVPVAPDPGRIAGARPEGIGTLSRHRDEAGEHARQPPARTRCAVASVHGGGARSAEHGIAS